MTNSQRLATVRRCLQRWVAKRDPTAVRNGPLAFDESILIRGGYFCGRRFDAERYQAVWFLEEDQLKIADRAGELLCVLAGDEIISLASAPSDVLSGERPEGPPLRRAA